MAETIRLICLTVNTFTSDLWPVVSRPADAIGRMAAGRIDSRANNSTQGVHDASSHLRDRRRRRRRPPSSAASHRAAAGARPFRATEPLSYRRPTPTTHGLRRDDPRSGGVRRGADARGGRADDRHRRAGLPAVRHRRRPDDRRGLRGGRRLRRRRAARLRRRRRRVGAHAVRRGDPARARRTSTSTSSSSRSPRSASRSSRSACRTTRARRRSSPTPTRRRSARRRSPTSRSCASVSPPGPPAWPSSRTSSSPSSDVQVFNTTPTPCRRCRPSRSTASSSTCRRRCSSRAVEIEGGVVVGQFPPIDAAPGEDWGLLFEQDNPLVECVDYALLAAARVGRARRDHDDVDGRGHRRAGLRPRVSAPAPGSGGAGTLTVSTRARRQEFERRQRRTSIAHRRRLDDGRRRRPRRLAAAEDRRDGRRSASRSSTGPCSASSFRPILRAFWLDIRIFLVCAPCIVVVALLVAMARNVRTPALFPLRLAATVYTDVVRGVPVILWITMLGFGVPGLLQTREWYGRPIIWGSVALDPHLLGVRRRGLPCRDRERPRVAARGGPFARALGRPDDAFGRPAPGGSPGRSRR